MSLPLPFAWIVSFSDGGSNAFLWDFHAGYVRAVRGGL